MAINPTCSNGIRGNVNLVINGGTFIANNKTIDVKNLIVTGGELWARSDSSTKVTYDNLSSYDNIKCTAGILPGSVDFYDYLSFFGNLTLPVDLTIQKELSFVNNATLTIPTGRSMTFSNYLNVDESIIISNNGALTLNGSQAFLGKLVNSGTLYINSLVTMNEGDITGALTNTGTISGSGYIDPEQCRASQNQPSLTVKSIENGAVTLEADGDGKTALEYSADDTNWQDSPTFTGVDLSEGRTFSARYKADGQFYQASAPASLTFCPVKLDANGGTIASGKDVAYHIVGQGVTLPAKDDVKRPGFTFAGWYANEDLTGDAVTEISATDTGIKTFWAKWTPETYTVALNANGGTINSGNVTGYTHGVGATLPTDVTRPGYTFAGWYDNVNCTGEPVTAIGADETGVKKFWAGWIAVPVITAPAENTTITVYEGEQATMSITAKNAVAYQWYMSTDGGVSWSDCGTNSPAYITAPTKLENNGYQYMCVVTGSNELDKEELPPDAVMSLRSRSRSKDDGLLDKGPAVESPIFTLQVIRKDAIPQTGDTSRPAAWLALLGACCAGLWCVSRRRR